MAGSCSFVHLSIPIQDHLTSLLYFTATAGAESTSSIFFLINDLKNWTEAQSYCRIHYTDLASVRNQAENDQMSMMLTQGAWIGLYRNSWKWSDGSSLSFSYWYPGHAPTATTTDSCVAAFYSKWTNRDCTFHYYFLCFVGDCVVQPER
uniref:C-type lectin domain-containing protein n=1 Tax=Anabas testudineus TaxID=64144 RepID=A0A3Q1ILZ5_ANATE